jgi:DNA-binding transcriptional MerR regulator
VDSYTLADLERVTGAKRRSLQLWADAGVIEPERGTNRAGTGTHRRFSREQAIVACIIRGFAERQMAIGELLAVAKMIKEFFRLEHRVKPLVESIIRGEEDWMLILETWKVGRVAHRASLLLPGGLGVLQAAMADWMLIKLGVIRPGYDVRLAKITTETAEDGEVIVMMPIAHFEKPEAIAVAIRLRTYLSKMDS